MSNIFCLRNLQESTFVPNYDNTILYKEIEESFTAETFRFLIEMNDAFREETKIFYRTVMESGNEFEIINEGVSDFLAKIKEIISRISKKYDTKLVVEIIDNLKSLGFQFSYKSGISFKINDLCIY